MGGMLIWRDGTGVEVVIRRDSTWGRVVIWNGGKGEQW